jgi:hypothetical protein
MQFPLKVKKKTPGLVEFSKIESGRRNGRKKLLRRSVISEIKNGIFTVGEGLLVGYFSFEFS